MTRRPVVVVLVCAAGAVACSIDETHYEEVVIAARPKTETITCSSPFVKPDLGQLKACGGGGKGKGHCYRGSKAPVQKSELEPCDGNDSCVPDKLLAAAGTKARACTFFLDGRPGACVSLLMKSLFANKDVLKQDACAEDERCLPCVDPRNGKTTGLCDDTGVHEADCTGGPGEKAVACCHKMGECVSPEAVPKEARSSMVPDTCKTGKVCAPTSQLDAKPVKCSFLGARGICLDVCFAEGLKGMTAVTRAGCGPTELCMPCALTNMSDAPRLIGCE